MYPVFCFPPKRTQCIQVALHILGAQILWCLQEDLPEIDAGGKSGVHWGDFDGAVQRLVSFGIPMDSNKLDYHGFQ